VVVRAVAAISHGSTVRYFPRGASRDVFAHRDRECLIEGPAGTGKTFGMLWKLHLMALKHPGMRGLMVRKTLESLKASALVTYQERIIGSAEFGVVFFGGNKIKPAHFRYPNGSIIVMGGIDKPAKIMSSEYDVAYINEATELTEADWESISVRLRYNRMPYQQLLADCNPDVPTHWLNQRCNAGNTVRLISRHKDNPALFDVDSGQWTSEGVAYMARLNSLSGVRLKRLRDGVWCAADGQVYEEWDPAIHLVDRFAIPEAWPRYWSIDFGYTNPFVWQAWAEDPDGRLFRYREIYMTGMLVEDAAPRIKALTADEPRPKAIVTDHDAEDRATFERHIGMKTNAADKRVSTGIQAVTGRLKHAGDGKPRLFFLRDSLVNRDPSLVDRRAPLCTEEEFPSYVWDVRQSQRKGEHPIKDNDHGQDATRYMVMFREPGNAKSKVIRGYR